MLDNSDREHHFVGTFNVAGESINGEMIYNKTNGTIVLSLIKLFSDAPSLGKTYGNLDIITGTLNSGIIVTFFNNRCTQNSTHNFNTQQLIYVAEYMIWSKCEAKQAKYNRLVCVLENALEWSGMTALDTSDPLIMKIKSNVNKNIYHWFDAKITFSTSLKYEGLGLPRQEESIIVERLEVAIETDEKQDIPYFVTIRNKVISLISFAIKDNINIQEQYFNDFDDGQQIGKSFEYHKHYLYTSERRLMVQHNQFWDYNFTLSQLPPEKDIQSELDLLTPIFNLYLSLFKYTDMPIEMIFLNIVQAIETFHSRFFYDDNKEKYVESVHERFASCPNYSDIEKLLLNETQKDDNCKYIILVSRLNDLLIGEYDGLFWDYYMTDSGFAQTIADTRHYYTHYGKIKERKALKGQELVDAIRILSLLLEYYVCLKLGIDNKERVRTALKNIESWKQFHREYQKKSEQDNNLS